MQAEKFIILPGENIPVNGNHNKNNFLIFFIAPQIKITNHFSIDKEKKAIVANNMGELFIKQTKNGLVVSSITTPQKVYKRYNPIF